MAIQDAAADVRVDALFDNTPSVNACPYPHYDAVRAEPGLHYSAAVDAYLITRHADAQEVLRDWQRFSNKIPFGRVTIQREREAIKALLETEPDLADLLARLKPRRAPMLVSADPPLHMRQRRLLQNLFSPRYITDSHDFVRDLTRRLIDAFADQPTVELVNALAVPMPVQVIAVLMGVEPERQADFKRWSDCFVSATGEGGDVVAAIRGQTELFDYFKQQIDERRARPRDDLVTRVMDARQPGDEPFTDDEVIAVLSQMLVAGNETTSALIASSLMILAQHPDLADRLRREPERIPDFVEEVMRLETPAKATFRTVIADTTVGGFPVPAGGQLMILFGAANRDPAACPSTRVELDPVPKMRHVGFGNGQHFCLGAPLARMEAKIVVEEMLGRFARIELAEPEAGLDYVPIDITRSLARLDLKLTPRG